MDSGIQEPLADVLSRLEQLLNGSPERASPLSKTPISATFSIQTLRKVIRKRHMSPSDSSRTRKRGF